MAHVELEHNKCLGEVRLSWLSKFPCTYIIKCEAGTVEGDVYDYQGVFLINESGRKKRIKLKPETKAGIAFRIVTNFIDVITRGEKPLVAGSDVLNSIQFIDECYEVATKFDMPWYQVQELESGS